MKYLLVILSFLCANSFAQDFSGCWKKESGSSTYDIAIHEDNGKLFGTYCFINANGNRIDCDKDNSLIDGVVEHGVGKISFGGSGEGELMYKNDHLNLKMIDSTPFDNFNMHIPENIEFLKASKCK